ncbi:MAG: hypothetical protein KDB21_15545 [Acidimicrobiales bacterium]|nr:hypothetical protein [Acidimicrobiales bacterium]
MRSLVRPRHPAYRELDPPTRRLRGDVVRFAVRSGRSLSLDALDVTLAVAVDFNGSAYRWTAESLGSFVWVDVLAWCQERELEPPSGVTTALAVLIDHLDASASLHPGSGRGDDLRAAARSLGGATARRRHPSQGTAAVLVLPVPTPAG